MTLAKFAHPEELLGRAGTKLGPTEYIKIEQEQINLFADATGDHQWIHVDEEKAKASDFGSTIAHGYLTLALCNYFLPQMIEVNNISMGVNYGADNVRFPSVVKVNSRVRAVGEIIQVDKAKGGIRSVVRVTIEVEGSERPGCVVDTISIYYL